MHFCMQAGRQASKGEKEGEERIEGGIGIMEAGNESSIQKDGSSSSQSSSCYFSIPFLSPPIRMMIHAGRSLVYCYYYCHGRRKTTEYLHTTRQNIT